MSLTPGPKWKPAFSPLTPAGGKPAPREDRRGGLYCRPPGLLAAPSGSPPGTQAGSWQPATTRSSPTFLIPGSSGLEEGSAP